MHRHPILDRRRLLLGVAGLAGVALLPRSAAALAETRTDYIRRALPRVPTLPQLAARFPDLAPIADWRAQLDRIHQIDATVAVTPADFAALTVDTSHAHDFDNQRNYGQRITPTAFMIHWTVDQFPDGVGQFTAFMNNRGGLRTEFYLDKAARAYQLFDTDTRMPAHAAGCNDFSQGVEIEATGLLDYTDQQIRQVVCLALAFCQRNNLPVDGTSILGHYGADLLFNNSSFNPNTGSLSSVRKLDPPQELIDVIVGKAQALDEALRTPRLRLPTRRRRVPVGG